MTVSGIGAWFGLNYGSTKHQTVHRAALEVHNILSQRSRLVRKDVFDLPEIGHSSTAGHSSSIGVGVVHVNVQIDQNSHNQRDELNSNVKG